ncbi:MAG: hypothetical protein ABI844_03020 [Saprospiraceae bacterium]
MKKLFILSIALFALINANFAQTASTSSKPDPKPQVVKKSSDAPQGKVVKMHSKTKKTDSNASSPAVNSTTSATNVPVGKTTKTEKAKPAANTSNTTSTKLKADGTPDKRYKSNKHLKADGTSDKRFKENKKQN